MTTTAVEKTEGLRKPLRGIKTGVVTSDRRSKTRSVLVAYQIQHSKYSKYLKQRSTYQVHDPNNHSKVGDRVEIASCRPISKTKCWRLIRVIESSPGPDPVNLEP